MNLEIFARIDDVVERFEEKRDIYKLIAEEIKEYFETSVFTRSRFTLSLVYRIKAVDSIREKLLRNSYISTYGSVDEVMRHFQDLIGFRIECKFIDDEVYVYNLLKEVFSETEDNVYYFDPLMPKIRFKLSEKQPQKQKNGFNIYKIDGLYLLGKEQIRFELQIKALVNTFWGEIEHKIIYKNSEYSLADKFVADLMFSIKKSLNMIDSQLYVLYNRFKRAGDVNEEKGNARSIERFISKMVNDTYMRLIHSQVGITVDFKSSCDAVIRYIMDVNNAKTMEDYGHIMLSVFDTLNSVEEGGLRVDEQLVFDRKLYFADEFSKNIYETILYNVNINYKWYLFFLILFHTSRGDNSQDLESYIAYYRNIFLQNRSLMALDELKDGDKIRFDILNEFSRVFREAKTIDYFCDKGITHVHRAMNAVLPKIVELIHDGAIWDVIKEEHLAAFREKVRLK